MRIVLIITLLSNQSIVKVLLRFINSVKRPARGNLIRAKYGGITGGTQNSQLALNQVFSRSTVRNKTENSVAGNTPGTSRIRE